VANNGTVWLGRVGGFVALLDDVLGDDDAPTGTSRPRSKPIAAPAPVAPPGRSSTGRGVATAVRGRRDGDRRA
jgi:hypothetical protein